MTAEQESARSWFARAVSDLRAARKLAQGPDAYLDTGIYHCQQAAEKALKGFLVYHGQPVEKTHDVRSLVSLAGQFGSGFDTWLDAGSRLTAYATESDTQGLDLSLTQTSSRRPSMRPRGCTTSCCRSCRLKYSPASPGTGRGASRWAHVSIGEASAGALCSV